MSGARHTIGLTFGRPFTWTTYCVECSDAAQEWVAVCPNWRDVPPRVLVSRDQPADDDYLPNGTPYPGPSVSGGTFATVHDVDDEAGCECHQGQPKADVYACRYGGYHRRRSDGSLWHHPGDQAMVPAEWVDIASKVMGRQNDLTAERDGAQRECADLHDALDAARMVIDEALAKIRRRDQAGAWSAAAAVVAGSIDVEHLTRQAEFSARTFGPGRRTRGVIDHITKEFGEILADPSVVDEWIDVIILAFDGALRTGAAPANVIAAIKAKQAENEARTWPDFRDFGEDVAIEHHRGTAG